METGTVTTTQSATSTTKKAPSQEMDKNAFLMLLVQQLKSQDPTQAQDPNQMVQQMTSYANLEQVQNQTKLLEGIQTQNLGLFQMGLTGMVGKHIKVTSPNFNLKDGKATIGLSIPADADITLTIKDAKGNVVATLNQGQQKAGTKAVDWDGRSSTGEKLTDGTYTVEVTAKDASGKSVEVKTTSTLTVESVSFADGTAFLLAGGRQWKLSDVTEIFA